MKPEAVYVAGEVSALMMLIYLDEVMGIQQITQQ